MSGLLSPGPPSIDPDKERSAPPQPTLVYFPQNDFDLQSEEAWPQHLPDLFHAFASIGKPSDVIQSHVASLNMTTINDLGVDDIIPSAPDGTSYLPPRSDLHLPKPESRRSSSVNIFAHPSGYHHQHHQHLLLSNGARAPDMETFGKFARELVCSTDSGLRVVGKRKPRAGTAHPHLHHYRDFWIHLDAMSQHWDTSLDEYYDGSKSAPPSPPTSRRDSKRKSFFGISGLSNHSPATTDSSSKPEAQRYRGRRTSSGARMPEQYRIDTIRALIRPIAYAFDCTMSNPRSPPKLQIKTLLIPVTQNSIVWRHPSDKLLARQGFLEGPLLGIQCRNETSFMRDPHAAIVDVAREAAGILLLAQERAREGQLPVIPGQGSWWVTQRRWGGGKGGDFGEAEQKAMEEAGKIPHGGAALGPNGIANVTAASAVKGKSQHARKNSAPYSVLPNGKTEEELWRELKPGKSLWEPKTNYLAVGKPDRSGFDVVFMISSLYHHVSILRLDIHPLFIKFTETQRRPSRTPPAATPPAKPWYKPTLQRTRWYDLLDPEDRGELLRGVWGVFAYLQRSHPRGAGGGEGAGAAAAAAGDARPQTARHKSESGRGGSTGFGLGAAGTGGTGLFSGLRRKSKAADVQTPRSHSIG